MNLDEIDLEFLSELRRGDQIEQELTQLKEWLDEYNVQERRND
ncbi:hypothetical protein [Mesobacillus selenatarsenatis]|uniref:Uncharacterized protein n=1 Tax=Mesobacillus selenatarsenatis (strain DSM 18680 / JCM 14380 / FERM P-15431 / SF-1) TaxID=1321606 RepID=A0A0A8X1L8_MESS1|nr:hypothetical protein [Mesobacillus selenatarsenatis]GAM12036.1 hypothetical protein SAMD00020551_0155 [Mesobacillus selenatarsenatis SF-1]